MTHVTQGLLGFQNLNTVKYPEAGYSTRHFPWTIQSAVGDPGAPGQEHLFNFRADVRVRRLIQGMGMDHREFAAII